jgi:hypothetical protein
MPSEQSHPGNASPARKGATEKSQYPPIIGGVRGLLGLPMRESGVLSTAPLTAPLRGHYYGQPPLPASAENDESFREVTLDAGLSEEGGIPDTDSQSEFPHLLPRDGVAFPRAIPENPVETRLMPSAMSVEQREHTSLVIPGVSTHRTAFVALSHTSDTTQVTQPEASQEPRPDQAAPLHTPVSLPHTRETAMPDSEFLSRLAHFVTDGAKAQHSPETQHRSVAVRSPSPVEQMGVPNGERSDADVAQRLTQLQRTVSELATTISAQAAHMRDESQVQGRARLTPPQRTVVVQRVDASSTTPSAFWERSRLGRLYLRTGR